MKALAGMLAIAAVAAAAFIFMGAFGPRIQTEPGPISAPKGIYDPVAAGEEMPDGFHQLLSRDAIFPIYNPIFHSATGAGWSDETLVIGVELAGEAKAYPVSFLNSREMVIDWIGGTPILVSW